MRVITGTAKGKPLKTLDGRDTRPSSDSVKETMFSAVQFDVEGAVVLDLFAGSGQLGIEALSRGAGFVYFADNNPRAITVIKENLESLEKAGMLSNSENGDCQLYRIDRLPYHAFLKLLKAEIDIAFLDPPYERGILEKVLPMLIPKMSVDGIIVCEHEKRLCLPKEVDTFRVDKVYGKSTVSVTVYRRS
jgi:16S rRNA (guanine(966)-N(2))-methyltransferase RsmD